MGLEKCSENNYEKNCPVMDIHDRLNECYFHITEMARFYHVPSLFRYSLNAFLSSFQSIKYLIKSKAKKDDGIGIIFDEYFEKLDDNHLFIKKIFDSRNEVVHEHNLSMSSTAIIGLYRYKNHKIGIFFPIKDIFENTESILKRLAPSFIEELGFLDKSHSDVGEEVGVEREWIVDSISKKEILSECLLAFDYMASVVGKIHHLYNKELIISVINEKNLLKCKIVTESDLDPSLPQKWGWVK